MFFARPLDRCVSNGQQLEVQRRRRELSEQLLLASLARVDVHIFM